MLSTEAKYGELNVHTVESGGLTWVNIDSPTEAEMHWLRDRYNFHPLALEDCLSPIQIPKVDYYDTYLFLVLHFPIFNHRARITLPAEVDIFVGPDYVVTVHSGTLKPLVKLFQDCSANEGVRASIMRRSAGYLLYRILDVLVDYCFPILNKVIKNVDEVEMRVFDGQTQDLVRELSIIRRDIIAYRRIIRSQIAPIEALERSEFEFLKVDPDVYFGDLADHIRRIWVQLEELKEVIEGLSDAHSSLTGHQTNQVIRILTLISTIMLPLSVVSGLYGMNVSLPLAESPYAFLVVLVIMAAIAGVMLLFFRARHWI